MNPGFMQWLSVFYMLCDETLAGNGLGAKVLADIGWDDFETMHLLHRMSARRHKAVAEETARQREKARNKAKGAIGGSGGDGFD